MKTALLPLFLVISIFIELPIDSFKAHIHEVLSFLCAGVVQNIHCAFELFLADCRTEHNLSKIVGVFTIMIHTIIAHELCEVEYFVRIQPLLSKTISDIGNHDCVTVFQGQTGCSLNVKFLSTLITIIRFSA